MIRLDLPEIRRLCKARGMSPTELAASLGVCDATVRSWSASCTRRVPMDAVDKIARMLGCEWREVILDPDEAITAAEPGSTGEQ